MCANMNKEFYIAYWRFSRMLNFQCDAATFERATQEMPDNLYV